MRLSAALASLCRAQYAESGVTALCSLRSQLHLAQNSGPTLHGSNTPEMQYFHRIAFLLDVSVREGHCDPRRLAEIVAALEALETAAAAAARQIPKVVIRKMESSEGMVKAEDPAVAALADCAMALRDPPALHLLLHETARAAQDCFAHGADPAADSNP